MNWSTLWSKNNRYVCSWLEALKPLDKSLNNFSDVLDPKLLRSLKSGGPATLTLLKKLDVGDYSKIKFINKWKLIVYVVLCLMMQAADLTWIIVVEHESYQ